MGTVETVAVTFVIVVICALFLFMVYVLSKKEEQRDAAKVKPAEKAKDDDDDYDEEYYNPGATAEEMVRKHFEVAYYDLLKHLVFRDWEKVLKVLSEVVDYADLSTYATQRHFFLLSILEIVYKLRDADPFAYNVALTICDYDLLNIENLIARMDHAPFYLAGNPNHHPFNMVTPTRKAIILEKIGEIEEAIKVCEIGIIYDVWDAGKKSFEERKARLEKKLAKK